VPSCERGRANPTKHKKTRRSSIRETVGKYGSPTPHTPHHLTASDENAVAHHGHTREWSFEIGEASASYRDTATMSRDRTRMFARASSGSEVIPSLDDAPRVVPRRRATSQPMAYFVPPASSRWIAHTPHPTPPYRIGRERSRPSRPHTRVVVRDRRGVRVICHSASGPRDGPDKAPVLVGGVNVIIRSKYLVFLPFRFPLSYFTMILHSFDFYSFIHVFLYLLIFVAHYIWF
jgi:hypothetical protein